MWRRDEVLAVPMHAPSNGMSFPLSESVRPPRHAPNVWPSPRADVEKDGCSMLWQ